MADAAHGRGARYVLGLVGRTPEQLVAQGSKILIGEADLGHGGIEATDVPTKEMPGKTLERACAPPVLKHAFTVVDLCAIAHNGFA